MVAGIEYGLANVQGKCHFLTDGMLLLEILLQGWQGNIVTSREEADLGEQLLGSVVDRLSGQQCFVPEVMGQFGNL